MKDGEQWRKTLVVNVRNDDGSSRTPATIKITPPEKPVPVRAGREDASHRSGHGAAVEIQRADLRAVRQSAQERRTVARRRAAYPLDLKKVKKNGTKFELRETVEVALEWEANRLRLVAVNDGGEASVSAVVSLPRPPVRVLWTGSTRWSRTRA